MLWTICYTQEQEFLNSRCIVRSEIAGLQGVLICTFTRYFPMLLQGGSATGCSYKLYARLLLAPYFVDESAAAAAAAAAKSSQSYLTLCDPIDSSPPGSPVPGILQARTLEGVAISFSNTWKWKVKVKSLSRAWLLATPMDCNPPGSSTHGILQARALEWG